MSAPTAEESILILVDTPRLPSEMPDGPIKWSSVPAVRCPRTGKLHPDWTNLRIVEPYVVRFIDLMDPRPIEEQIAEGYRASAGEDLPMLDPRNHPVEETPYGAIIPPQNPGDMTLRELTRTVTPLPCGGTVIVFSAGVTVIVRDGRSVWAAWVRP